MDFKKILSDASVSLLRNLVSLLRGLVLIPLITKTIGTDVYGVWTIVISTVGIVVTVGSVHSHGTLIRYSTSEEDSRRISSEVLVIALSGVGLLTIGYVVAELTVGIVSTQSAVTSRELFTLWVALLIGGEAVFSVLKNVPRAQGRVKTYEGLWIGRKLIEIAVLVAAFWVTSSLLVAVAALATVVILFDIGLAVRYIGRTFHLPTRENLRKYLGYGVPMIPKELSGTLLTHGDKFLILYFLSPTAVGIYAVSYSLARALYTFSGVLNSTLYPAVTTAWDEGDRDSVRQLYTGVVRAYTILGLPAIAGVALLSQPVLRLISTEEVTTGGQLLLPLLAAGFVVYGYANPMMYVLNAAEENEKIGLVTTVAAALNLVINAALIPLYGLVGAVAATIASFLLITGYVVFHVRQHVRFSVPVRTGLLSIVATGIMTGSLVLLPVSGVVRLGVYPVVGAVVYFVALLAMGGITREDLSGVAGLVASE
jgi:O-antigen/teichoic acid export membrane protein